MANETLTMEPDYEAYEAELAEQRMQAEAMEREKRQKMLREKGRLPEQQHIPLIEFAAILIPAILNDAIDLVELGELTLVAAIPIKVVLVAVDISTALIIMMWGSARQGTGFWATRRIVAAIATIAIEFIPIGGIVPAWSLFILFCYATQKIREETVKRQAKKDPQKAEQTAIRMEAGTQKLKSGLAKSGEKASLPSNTTSLRGDYQARNIVNQARKDEAARLMPGIRKELSGPLAQFQGQDDKMASREGGNALMQNAGSPSEKSNTIQAPSSGIEKKLEQRREKRQERDIEDNLSFIRKPPLQFKRAPAVEERLAPTPPKEDELGSEDQEAA